MIATRVFVKQTMDRERCSKCQRSLRFGQHYTATTTTIAGARRLYRMSGAHYPNCELPTEGFGDDGMGRTYTTEADRTSLSASGG